MAPLRKRTKIEQARKHLAGGAVFREDSDDELGYEDHPWEWIYKPTNLPKDGSQDGQCVTPRKRKSMSSASDGRIIGARMGNFQCKLGDAVLLKAEWQQAWVGIITDFFEDEEEDEKMASFLWFSSEREIRNKAKKRTDFLPVRQSQSTTVEAI